MAVKGTQCERPADPLHDRSFIDTLNTSYGRRTLSGSSAP
jgi:hypothetical protein